MANHEGKVETGEGRAFIGDGGHVDRCKAEPRHAGVDLQHGGQHAAKPRRRHSYFADRRPRFLVRRTTGKPLGGETATGRVLPEEG
mgnify:CR=1 FL=1